ncbi:MAG: phytanoyl-CoA dioxygenase family protein [Caldilineaceae bacterium]
MATAIQHDLELMQYLLDLQGYLVIENALSADEVATLNRLINDQQLPPPGKTQRFGSAPEGAGFLDWGQPFVDLLDHPTLMPILRLQLGDSFRLDRLYGMYMNEGMGRGALHADYGALARNEQTQPGEYYSFRRNQIYDGFVVVTWNLADAGPDYGGFCCIPGSHKSHYKLPQSIADNPEACPAVIIPEAPAGSDYALTGPLPPTAPRPGGAPMNAAPCSTNIVCSHIAWTNGWPIPSRGAHSTPADAPARPW